MGGVEPHLSRPRRRRRRRRRRRSLGGAGGERAGGAAGRLRELGRAEQRHLRPGALPRALLAASAAEPAGAGAASESGLF